MKNISEFFKRIGGIQAKQIALRASIQAAVKESIGLEIPLGDISVRSGSVTLKGLSQSARSVLFIHKLKILTTINDLQSIEKITDIR
jgi:hypothetical protein